MQVNDNVVKSTVMVGIRDFAIITGIGQGKVRNLCNLPDFPAMKSGKKYLIHRDEALIWLAKYVKSSNEGGVSSAL